MRSIPDKISDDGLLVGWSLEPVHRKKTIGFSHDGESDPAFSLEPILDNGEGHLITVAPTGAGKGVSCIIPALLRYDGPVIVVDPKGENYAVTAQRRRELGQRVILFDPLNITGAEERHRFNPLDLVDPESDRFIEDISTVATLLNSKSGNTSGDYDFWDRMGRSLTTAAILDVLTMSDSDKSTLDAARDIINLPVDALQKRAERWSKEGCNELKNLAALLNNPADVTIGGYVAHAIHQLDFLKGRSIEEHLSYSDLDLNDIYSGEPVSIYLVLPPDKLESHAPLLRLWIGVMISVMTRRNVQPDKSTLIIVDEAAQLGSMPQLKQAITLLRGFGVRVWTFWQDMSQIKNLYPHDWETILNNCKVQQFFGATTGLAASAISEVSGFQNQFEVMDLEPDEMILNIPGDVPVIVAKPNYLRDMIFKDQYNPNPFYRKSNEIEGHAPLTRPVFRKTYSPREQYRRNTLSKEAVVANRIFLPVTQDMWVDVDTADRKALFNAVGLGSSSFFEDDKVQVQRYNLPFYENLDYIKILNSNTDPCRYSLHLVCGDIHYLIDGSSNRIHRANERFLRLNRKNIVQYVKFFFSSIKGDDGRFLIIDSIDDIEWTEKPDEAFISEMAEQIRPPAIKVINTDGGESVYGIDASVIYGKGVFNTRIEVNEQSGFVEMFENTYIAKDLPIIHDNNRLCHIGQFDEKGIFTPIIMKEA